jgi:cell wall-active antibiotic response 4TMS protein YvqF/B-box zinc finger protein
MNCANHPATPAVAYCRTCGKPLCASCTREVQGVVYCEQCLAERMGHPVTQPNASGFVASNSAPVMTGAGPHPAVAGILAGFFPFGVGAVYTGQYAKGLAHLVTFTLLVWGADVIHNGGMDTILGLGIAFFYVYQIVDAVRSAQAIRMGQAPPDPFGLAHAFGSAEVFHERSASSRVAAPFAQPNVGQANVGQSNAGQPYYAAPQPVEPPAATSKAPTAAVVLIGLGLLFLLHTTNLWYFNVDRLWPLILIGLGGWLLYRKITCTSGGYRRDGRPYRTRGLIGPAVLITVGLLSLIESYNGPGWDRTWPLLLLVIGVVKLVDRTNPQAQPLPPMPPVPPAGPPVVPPPATPVDAPPSSEVNRG